MSVCLLSGTGEAQRDLIYNRTLKSGFSFIALQLKMGQIAAHKPIIEMKYNFFNIRFFFNISFHQGTEKLEFKALDFGRVITTF